LRVLFVGDIVGRPGRACIRDMLPKIKSNYGIDVVIANGENSAAGVGLTKKVFDELTSYGIDIITSGNHIWDKKDIFDFIDGENRILRPINYPRNRTPGRGWGLFQTTAGSLGVINVSGNVFMPDLDCPFAAMEEPLRELHKLTSLILVDFHAETTSEKIAMGWFLDGRVSAVLGTHTHVQTADERVLPEGTAYITDVGMTGAYNGVLGVKKEIVLEKFLSKMPARFEVETKEPYQLNAVVLHIDPVTGKSLSIERIYDLHPPE
jgi:2',3'-cyclic-nucleotide 2'-phosphodiesterase